MHRRAKRNIWTKWDDWRAVDVATPRAAEVRVNVVGLGYPLDAVSTDGADFVIDHFYPQLRGF